MTSAIVVDDVFKKFGKPGEPFWKRVLQMGRINHSNGNGQNGHNGYPDHENHNGNGRNGHAQSDVQDVLHMPDRPRLDECRVKQLHVGGGQQCLFGFGQQLEQVRPALYVQFSQDLIE